MKLIDKMLITAYQKGTLNFCDVILFRSLADIVAVNPDFLTKFREQYGMIAKENLIFLTTTEAPEEPDYKDPRFDE